MQQPLHADARVDAPRTITVGCKFCSRNGSAMCSISPAARAPGRVSARSADGGTRHRGGCSAPDRVMPRVAAASRAAPRSASRRGTGEAAGARVPPQKQRESARVRSTDAAASARAAARTQDDDARGPVAHLLVLRARQLDHALRSAAGAACQRSSARAAAAGALRRALAAGCDTSISRKIALPSFVSTMPARTQRQRRRAARQRHRANEPPRVRALGERPARAVTPPRTAGGIQQHLQHRARAQRGADDVRNGLHARSSNAARNRQRCALRRGAWRCRDAPWRRRCCPSAPCAPCRASYSGLRSRAAAVSQLGSLASAAARSAGARRART